MKKILFVWVFIVFGTISYSQTKQELAGMWKIVVDAGMKQTTPTYLMLNADGTYLWGIDSTSSDPNKSVSKGTWDFTDDKMIKIIPESAGDRATYYVQRTDKYDYYGYDDNGKKTPEITLDYGVYLMKCK